MRTAVFWMHFTAGAVAGVIILVMCATGVAIAFEKEAVGIAEKSIATAQISRDAKRLSLDELVQMTTAQRGSAPSSITVFSDPTLAWTLSYGRTNILYINSYTGQSVEQPANGTRGMMRRLTEWHRWLGREGDGKAVGKAITGVCNGAFLFMAISGLYLWIPRQLNWSAVRGIILFRRNIRGKARDWNWHNVIGFWTSPILIVLTASGLVMSYRWANDLVFKISGSPIPSSGSGPGMAGAPPPEVDRPATGSKRLSYEDLFDAAKRAIPSWKQFELRLGSDERGRGASASSKSSSAGKAFGISFKANDQWPSFATSQLWLDPYSGAVLRKDSFSDFTAGRRARMWLRFLHTGEAFGIVGKIVAALASLGGMLLVWTGFSLAFRRIMANVGSTPSGGNG